MTKFASAAAAATILGLVSPALADGKGQAPADSAQVDEARQRFQRGVDLFKEGSYDAALAEFNKAYELAPNFRILYNIAQVQQERHDYVAALQFLERYLAQGGADVPSDRRDQVGRDITALHSRVAHLTITSEVAGAEVLVDGVSAGRTPLSDAILVSAGVRQIQLRKPGYEAATRSLTIAGGEAARAELHLTKLQDPGARAALASSTSKGDESYAKDRGASGDNGSRPAMWIALSTTALFTGGAVTFAVLTNEASKDLDDELNRIPADQSSIDDTRSRLRRDALLTDVLTAGAVVSGGFFLYFALSGSGSSARTEAATLRVHPYGRGLRVSGEF
jgi:hypothetical protein